MSRRGGELGDRELVAFGSDEEGHGRLAHRHRITRSRCLLPGRLDVEQAILTLHTVMI
ncbi:hypothetical protein ACFU76_00235 [Streptomyces sp. NPDC057539]|uniref:hypothetical protein n=1 Tax=Streptomyces sp. NPDC057539 TaxID=3346159 RepID=UPI00367CCC68